MKKLFPALLGLGLFIFASCATTDIPSKNGVPLTTENSVVVYGYCEDLHLFDDLSKIKVLLQSSDYKYEVLKCKTDDECFVIERPVHIDDKLKVMEYEIARRTLLGKVTAIETTYCGIGGYDMSFNKPQIYCFSFNHNYKESKKNKKSERKAVELALEVYENTEWAELLNKRLGELK